MFYTNDFAKLTDADEFIRRVNCMDDTEIIILQYLLDEDNDIFEALNQMGKINVVGEDDEEIFAECAEKYLNDASMGRYERNNKTYYALPFPN